MARTIAESGVHLSFDDVINQKDMVDKALIIMYSDNNVNFESLFVGKSRREVEIEKEKLMKESDKTHSLLLLTSVEAIIRLDAEERYRKRGKDALSKKIKEIYRARKNIKLEDHLIAARIEVEPELKRFYDELKVAFKYRHWLAHGRYWESNIQQIKSNSFEFTNLRLIIYNVISNSDFKEITN